MPLRSLTRKLSTPETLEKRMMMDASPILADIGTIDEDTHTGAEIVLADVGAAGHSMVAEGEATSAVTEAPRLVSSDPEIQSILDALSPEELSQVISVLPFAQAMQREHGYHKGPSYYLNDHRRGEISVLDREGNWPIIYPDGKVGEAGGSWQIYFTLAPVFHSHPEFLFKAETISILATQLVPVATVSAALPYPEATESLSLSERSKPIVSSDPEIQGILDALSPEELSQVISVLPFAQAMQREHGYHKGPSYYLNDHRRGEISVLDREGNWPIIYPDGKVGEAGGSWQIYFTLAPVFHSHPEFLFKAEMISIPRAAESDAVFAELGVASSLASSVVEIHPILAEAQRLQRLYNFTTDGRYYQNEHRMNEKTVRSETLQAWCIVTMNGEIRNADKGFELLGVLDETIWKDPHILTDALQAPSSESLNAAYVDAVLGQMGGEEAGNEEPFRYEVHALSIPGVREGFERLITDHVLSRLPPLQSREGLPVNGEIAFFAREMIGGAAAGKFWTMLYQMAEVEDPFSGVRAPPYLHGHNLEVYESLRRMPEIAEVEAIVREDFDLMYQWLCQFWNREAEQNTRQDAAASRIAATTTGPEPAESRLLSLNRSRLEVAWAAMAQEVSTLTQDARDQFFAALANAGFDPFETVAQGRLVPEGTVVASTAPVAQSEDGNADIVVEGVYFGADDSPDGKTNRQLFAEALRWYDPSVPMPSTLLVEAGHSSIVGRIFFGVVQKLWSSSDAIERLNIALAMERITDIPYGKVLDASQSTDPTVFTDAFVRLFNDAGYGHLFSSQEASTEPRVIGPVTDLPDYRNGNIRIRFDVETADEELVDVRVFAPGSDAILARTAAQTFIEVPVESLNMSADNLQLRVIAHFRSGREVSALTNTFDVGWDGTHASTEIDASGILDLQGEPLSEEQQQKMADALNFGDLDALPAGNRQILEYLIRTYIQSGELRYDTEGYVSSAGFELESISTHGGGQCKEWVFNMVPEATGVDVPKNDPNSAIRWLVADSDQVSEVPQDEGTFEGRVSALLSGDIIQLNYDSKLPHTIVVGKVAVDGLWVFDSNWGEKKIFKTVEGDAEQLVSDLNGDPIVLQHDETVRYHFMSFVELNAKAKEFTIYRITTE